MEAVLWQALAGTRGGPTRAPVLRAVDQQPRSASQLAADLDLADETVRHNLKMLEENDLVERTERDHGASYPPTNRTRQHRETVEDIVEQVECV